MIRYNMEIYGDAERDIEVDKDIEEVDMYEDDYRI